MSTGLVGPVGLFFTGTKPFLGTVTGGPLLVSSPGLQIPYKSDLNKHKMQPEIYLGVKTSIICLKLALKEITGRGGGGMRGVFEGLVVQMRTRHTAGLDYVHGLYTWTPPGQSQKIFARQIFCKILLLQTDIFEISLAI